jgi:hypothetical protein
MFIKVAFAEAPLKIQNRNCLWLFYDQIIEILTTKVKIMARNLNDYNYTGNLNHIPEQSGQPGQNPGFLFSVKMVCNQ